MRNNQALSGWLPPFTLPQKAQEAIAELIGQDSVKGVEVACQKYLGLADNYKNRPSRGIINRNLHKIHEYTSLISSILENKAVKEELDLLIQTQVVCSREFVEKNSSHFKSFTRDIELLNSATADYSTLSSGPPKGGDNKAVKVLAYLLYRCCINAGFKPTLINHSGKPSGLLHKILHIIREPLNIGRGTFDQAFTTVVKSIQSEEGMP